MSTTTTKSTTEFATLVAEAQKDAIAALKQAQDYSLKTAELALSLSSEKAENLPAPATVIESGFAFAAKVLETQKNYALRLTEIVGSASKN